MGCCCCAPKLISAAVGPGKSGDLGEPALYEPGWFSLSAGKGDLITSNYARRVWEEKEKYTGSLKVLVMCTDKDKLKVKSNKAFSTGHNPSEIFVPLLHITDAGFKVDLATATGGPVAIEEWGLDFLPYKDDIVQIRDDLKEQLANPIKNAEIAVNNFENVYAAIFFPGGHGSMIEMHNPPDGGQCGRLLRHAHANNILTGAICHGPNALRSAFDTEAKEDEFIYNGYEMSCFPDSLDESSPGFGYLPAKMHELPQDELKKLGPKITFANAKGEIETVTVCKELLTGATQKCAHAFGTKFVDLLISRCPEGFQGSPLPEEIPEEKKESGDQPLLEAT